MDNIKNDKYYVVRIRDDLKFITHHMVLMLTCNGVKLLRFNVLKLLFLLSLDLRAAPSSPTGPQVY